MKSEVVKGVFERESERMTSWLGTWVGIDKAISQTANAMALTWATASGGWITRKGPLQLLYAHGTTSKTLSAAAVGLTGPPNGMKNWVAPTLPEIKELCSVYVGIGFASSMAALQQEQEPALLEVVRQLRVPSSVPSFQYNGLRIDGKTRGVIKRLRDGFQVLGDSTPTWGYAMGRLWRHEVDQTILWISDVDAHARRV